jgi:hypothetical protein
MESFGKITQDSEGNNSEQERVIDALVSGDEVIMKDAGIKIVQGLSGEDAMYDAKRRAEKLGSKEVTSSVGNETIVEQDGGQVSEPKSESSVESAHSSVENYSDLEKNVGPENMNSFFMATLQYMDEEIKRGNIGVLTEGFRNKNTKEIMDIAKGQDSQQQADLLNRFSHAQEAYKQRGVEQGKPNLLEVNTTPADMTAILKIMFGVEK